MHADFIFQRKQPFFEKTCRKQDDQLHQRKNKYSIRCRILPSIYYFQSTEGQQVDIELH